MKKALLAIAISFGMAVAQADVFNIGLNTTNDMGGLLTGAFEATPNNSTATGGEVGIGISYDTTARVLDFNVAYGLFGYEPLTADFSGAHIHLAPVGEAGPIELSLAPIHVPVGTRAGFFSGTLPLTQAQEVALFNNQLYVNVHSTTFPQGEIRAQLVPTAIPEPSVWILSSLGIAALIVMRRRY